MLPTDPKAAAQRSLHGRWPVGCQKVHVEWRFQSSDPGKSQTATMTRGRRTSGIQSISWRATSRSNSFDRTARLEIGRYELSSEGSTCYQHVESGSLIRINKTLLNAGILGSISLYELRDFSTVWSLNVCNLANINHTYLNIVPIASCQCSSLVLPVQQWQSFVYCMGCSSVWSCLSCWQGWFWILFVFLISILGSVIVPWWFWLLRCVVKSAFGWSLLKL